MRWDAKRKYLPYGNETANCTIAGHLGSASPFELVLSQNKKYLHREGTAQHRKIRVRPAGNTKEIYGTLPNERDWPLRAAAWSTLDSERRRPQTVGFHNRP